MPLSALLPSIDDRRFAQLNDEVKVRIPAGVQDGQRVAAGAVVVTVEAMKMEHALSAPVEGAVELLVAIGDQVKVGQPLARIITKEDES